MEEKNNKTQSINNYLPTTYSVIDKINTVLSACGMAHYFTATIIIDVCRKLNNLISVYKISVYL